MERKVITRKSYPIENIYPNSWNVNYMSPKMFEALKESIRISGPEYMKLNPIMVRKIKKDQYEIIDGEKRWRAFLELKYTHIPAIVEDITLEKAKILNVKLNMNRTTGKTLEEWRKDDPESFNELLRYLEIIPLEEEML